MQSGIGKTRCKIGLGGAREYATPSFKIVRVVTLILFLLSCSHIKKHKKNKLENGEEMAISALSHMCFTSEGKGRLEAFRGRYVFRYESMQNAKKGLWTLALNIPLHGEELIKMRWENALSGKIAVAGSFYRRLVAEAKSKKSKNLSLFYLKGFIRKWSMLMKLGEESKKNKVLFRCEPVRKNGQWQRSSCSLKSGYEFIVSKSEERVQFSFPMGKNLFTVESFSKNKTFYSRQKYMLSRASGNVAMSLDLFVSSCGESGAK